MPKDQEKIKGRAKNTPAFVKIAQQALADTCVLGHADYAALKKALPTYAAKLNQRGETVTIDHLIEQALQGAEHIKSMSDSVTTKRTLTYDTVVAHFPKPPEPPKPNDENLSLEQHLSKAVYKGDLEKVKELENKGADIRAESDCPLRWAAQNGQLDIVKYLESKGADIHAWNDYAFCYAAANGHLDVVKYLESKGANTRARNMSALYWAAENGHLDVVRHFIRHLIGRHSIRVCDIDALRKAAKNGHLDVVKCFVDKGATDDEALRAAAKYGHLNVVKYLIDKGAKIDALKDYALCDAAQNGHLDVVKYLVDKGANIHADDDAALCGAAYNGHLDVVKYLIDKGADIHAKDDEALCLAAGNGHLGVVKCLIAKGANQERLSEDQQNNLSRYNLWLDTFGECPTGCHTFDPTLFTDKGVQDCFSLTSDALQNHEGYKDNKRHANQIAFKAAVLFRDPQVVLKYLRKWGEAGKQPLHDVIQMVQLPKSDLENVDLQSWQSAVMFHGPKMAKLFKFADKVTPQKSIEGKNWLYHETLKEVAKHAYPKAKKNPNLSALFMEHVMDEDDFDEALNLTKKYKKQYGAIDADKGGMIPDVSFTLPNGMTYKKLTDGDYKGMVLGNLTGCCQNIGGAGRKCAKHGYLSKDSGFYVVLDKKGTIIGQSWAWIGTENELVLDSLESLTGRVTPQDWQDVMAEFKTALNDNAKDITALHIGTGGETPDNMPYDEKAAIPKDYDGYRDSDTQYRVWKR